MDDEEEKKSMSTTVCCLCMKDNDFSSHMFVSLIFCIHLNWHRACLCVLATMRCRTRSTNERHIYIYILYIGKERMTASFVVHHVERISFLSIFFSLSRLIADADAFFFSLSLSPRHIIKQ